MKTDTPLVSMGWLRALIYFVLIFLAVLASKLMAPFIKHLLPTAGDAEMNLFVSFIASYVVTAVAVTLITLLVMRVVNRQPWTAIGFSAKGFGTEAGIGIFAPLAVLSIGTLVLIATQHLSITGASFKPVAIGLQLLLMLIVAFTEELIFRGYLLSNLMESMNKWVALLISSVLFAAVHLGNPDVSVVAIINVLLGGIVIGLNFVYTRSLAYSILFHFTWNFVQGGVLGYDVSGFQLPGVFNQVLSGTPFMTGGSFGFEGSFVCLVLLVIAIIVLYVGFERKYGRSLRSS